MTATLSPTVSLYDVSQDYTDDDETAQFIKHVPVLSQEAKLNYVLDWAEAIQWEAIPIFGFGQSEAMRRRQQFVAKGRAALQAEPPDTPSTFQSANHQSRFALPPKTPVHAAPKEIGPKSSHPHAVAAASGSGIVAPGAKQPFSRASQANSAAAVASASAATSPSALTTSASNAPIAVIGAAATTSSSLRKAGATYASRRAVSQDASASTSPGDHRAPAPGQELARTVTQLQASKKLEKATKTHNPLDLFNSDQLQNMPHDTLAQLFDAYDAKTLGYFDAKSSALQLFAQHMIDRILSNFRQCVKEKQPELSASSLEDIVKKERVYLLPNCHPTDDKQTLKAMQQHILLKFDHSGAGGRKVTKQQFMMGFNAFSTQLFKVREDGPLACSIQ